MGFKLKAADVFTWPVKAKVPNDGKYETVNFEVTFNVLSQAEINDLVGDGEAGSAVRLFNKAIASFTGIDVEDADGDLVTDEDERRDILLSKPFFVNAISDAWAAGLRGSRSKT
jgi:hypothetical protein